MGCLKLSELGINMAKYNEDDEHNGKNLVPPKKKPPKGELSDYAAKKIADVVRIMLNDK
jgi:hypothetical protein